MISRTALDVQLTAYPTVFFRILDSIFPDILVICGIITLIIEHGN